MAKTIDEQGNTYGQLTVIERAPPGKPPMGARWRCRCTCGKETVVLGTKLRSGHVKSCGCLAKWRQRIDERGNHYGRLTVLEPRPNRGHGMRWLCQCACGSTTTVRGAYLRNGSVRSCGCWRRDRAAGLHRYREPTSSFVTE